MIAWPSPGSTVATEVTVWPASMAWLFLACFSIFGQSSIMVMPPSELPDEVADDEDLARFIVQSRWLGSQSVKPAAFLPSQGDRETSVSRHGREPLARLWELGLPAAGARTLYGAAILKAASVRAAQLQVSADEP